MNVPLSFIGRNRQLFVDDIVTNGDELLKRVGASKFLVLGGAGSIGQAVTKEIFKRNPLKLHVVDLNENNLVELVRDIRSTYGYIKGEFKTFALDIGSLEYDSFFASDGNYDYVLNLSALKHVRSENDPYTLMRMIQVNIVNTVKTIRQSVDNGVSKYFCVSTDKAANPVNLMGASKRIMEMFLMRESQYISISTARFANVAFSDGSLLYGFNKRIEKKQPIVAPNDIRRYFVTPQESGELCLMSCIFGENRDIFFPKLSENLNLISFSEIAVKYLDSLGYKAFRCASEEEARKLVNSLPDQGKWPCLFAESDTTGEKDFEEFFTSEEVLDVDKYIDLGIIKNALIVENKKLSDFENSLDVLRNEGRWSKEQIVDLFHAMIPNFEHKEKGKYLDAKM